MSALGPPKVDTRKLPFGKIELYSSKYYAACMLGGIVACGPTHTFVTPLDLVKTRRQVDSSLYKSNIQGWRTIFAKEGLKGIFTGWSPTLVGYSAQGFGKYGFYEIFKHLYGDELFPNMNRTVVYLGASASAEFIADIMLCPFEALKVRMQTTIPPYAKNMRHAWAKTTAEGGIAKLYAGIVPLWGRQIPYTMIKFSSFEATVNLIYSKALSGKKEDYGPLAQTGVSFLAGYIAGILCAVGSHPADVMVSKLNSDRKTGESAGKAMSRIYGNIGFGGLWNGLPVRIAMIGTLTGLQWLIYDSFKVFLDGIESLNSYLNSQDAGLRCRIVRRLISDTAPGYNRLFRGYLFSIVEIEYYKADSKRSIEMVFITLLQRWDHYPDFLEHISTATPPFMNANPFIQLEDTISGSRSYPWLLVTPLRAVNAYQGAIFFVKPDIKIGPKRGRHQAVKKMDPSTGKFLWNWYDVIKELEKHFSLWKEAENQLLRDHQHWASPSCPPKDQESDDTVEPMSEDVYGDYQGAADNDGDEDELKMDNNVD
ncbi:hypothetical protein H072_27 [Dactylellina haptotyla CBS 200.50]|uniref:Mitochondrial phosphate carrier protein n=1 Tax=Dactylellina haptotyla (strain CBS 200.50) TaxID=1284197 RepID=S8AYA9_DACHA|nr:hypothetical protein H072_27 [Dactylellina haptotyla CBS 200.50]